MDKNEITASRLFYERITLLGCPGCAAALERAFLLSVALCFSKAVEILFWKHCGEGKQEAGRAFAEMQESEGSAVSIFFFFLLQPMN